MAKETTGHFIKGMVECVKTLGRMEELESCGLSGGLCSEEACILDQELK